MSVPGERMCLSESRKVLTFAVLLTPGTRGTTNRAQSVTN